MGHRRINYGSGVDFLDNYVMPRQVLILLLFVGTAWPQSADHLLGNGTGFLVSGEGHIVTNNHVAATCATLRVKLGDTYFPAQLVASDKQNDLALLKVNDPTSTPVRLRENPRVRLGENVISIGYPLQGIVASSLNLTTGTISALAGLGDDARVIQFSAPIQPGNSGGPLLDQSGNVVGVVTSKLSPLWTARAIGDIPQNVNFAIKSSVVKDFLDSRDVRYGTAISDSKLETADIGENVGKSVALIECFGTPSTADGGGVKSDIQTHFQTALNAYQRGDYVTAANEWRPLADQGDAPTQYNMALMYLDGHGVPQDYAEAFKWFKRSAEQGYTEAQHDLAAMYGAGRGVNRDFMQAYKWMSLCATKGNPGCLSQRELIGRRLSRTDLGVAQRLATEWKPTRETPMVKDKVE
jgi:S1-C subfamily serine protease